MTWRDWRTETKDGKTHDSYEVEIPWYRGQDEIAKTAGNTEGTGNPTVSMFGGFPSPPSTP